MAKLKISTYKSDNLTLSWLDVFKIMFGYKIKVKALEIKRSGILR